MKRSLFLSSYSVTVGVSNHKRAPLRFGTLHDVRLDEKACFAAAGTADDQYVLVPRVLGFAGRLLMVRRSVWVRMMLFHGSGSTNGAMSLGFPQRAAPYSSPCRYFLAFLRFACTSRHSAHPHRNPISRSRGTKPDSPFRNAIATPSRRCRNFAENPSRLTAAMLHSASPRQVQ